jgi:hypothetical protein
MTELRRFLKFFFVIPATERQAKRMPPHYVISAQAGITKRGCRMKMTQTSHVI